MAGGPPSPTVSTTGNGWIVPGIAVFPKVKCIGKHDVTEQFVRAVVCDVEGGVHLEIRRHVPGEPDGRRVTASTLKVDLGAERFIKVVGVTENDFVAITGMDGAHDEFLLLGVITGFEIG